MAETTDNYFPSGKESKKRQSYFREHIKGALGERLATLAEQGEDTRLSLDDEIDLARALVVDITEMYERIHRGDLSKLPGVGLNQQMASSEFLQRALDQISKLVSQVAKIRAVDRVGTFGPEAIKWLETKWSEILLKNFPGEGEKVMQTLNELQSLRPPQMESKVILAID